MHPTIITYLQTYYQKSLDNLFQQFIKGEILTQFEQERFLYEIYYHYWQLHLNSEPTNLDSTILDRLLQKFSIPLSSGDRILL